MNQFIISIFCEVDNFCKEINSYLERHSLSCDEKRTSMELPSALSLSEAISICILFYLTGLRTFKCYYEGFLSNGCQKFSNLTSYGWFVELMPYLAVPLAFFICAHSGKCIGISFVDSTTLDVCDSHRIATQSVSGTGTAGKELCRVVLWF